LPMPDEVDDAARGFAHEMHLRNGCDRRLGLSRTSI
jgi:hypothetical protein